MGWIAWLINCRGSRKLLCVVFVVCVGVSKYVFISPIQPMEIKTSFSSDSHKEAEVSHFDLIGDGFCRPSGCDPQQPTCRLNGFYKLTSSDESCKEACRNHPHCNGYSFDFDKDVCQVYTSGGDVPSGWEPFPHDYVDIAQASGRKGAHCYRYKAATTTAEAATTTEAPQQTKVVSAMKLGHTDVPSAAQPALMASAAMTPGTSAERWSFSYVELTVNGRVCPLACNSNEFASCGRCIQIGNGMRGGSHTRLFEVSNVFYAAQQGAWFHGADENAIIECGSACSPTWENWPAAGNQWHEYDGQPKERSKPDISCSPSSMIEEPALLARWMFPNNMYHFYLDTVLPTFMTVAYIAKVLGCSKERVKVFTTAGGATTRFFYIWNLFFPETQPASEMAGCYTTVFYGHMYNNVPAVNLKGIVYDPSLSSWMAAFRMNLKAGLVPKVLPERDKQGGMLLVHHNGVPNWFDNIDWSVPGVRIQPINLERLPYAEQIAVISTSQGMLGVGYGLVQHVFLPPRSLIGFVALLEARAGDALGENLCSRAINRGDSEWTKDEENALHYVNMAINGGHHIVMWRWCRPELFTASAKFESVHAQAVLKLLTSFKTGETTSPTADSPKVHGCLILGGNPASAGWPHCDQHVVAPASLSLSSCQAYGVIGLPYNPADNSSFIQEDSRVKSVDYRGGSFDATSVSQSTELAGGKHSEQQAAKVLNNTGVEQVPIAGQWSFKYLPLRGKSIRCPVACNPNANKSCGRCIAIGNGMREGRNTHLFEVTNVFYKKEQGAYFYGEDAKLVKSCGYRCSPTWENWPRAGYQWYEYDGQPKPRRQIVDIICNPRNTDKNPALIARWMFPQNVFHFYSESVLTTFMTAGHIARVRGCTAQHVNVYLASGMSDTSLAPIWNLFFKKVQAASKMDGCYKSVFYGHMFQNVPRVDLGGVVHDPTLSSWMAAFSANIRQGLVGHQNLSKPTGHMLLVAHSRAPDWLRDIDWTVTGLEIRPVDFGRMPYREQVALVAVARGLLGAAGSGLAQQVFLPPRSLIAYFSILEAALAGSVHGTDVCVTRMSKTDPSHVQQEEAALCYANTGLNLGHTVLMWRWCRRAIFEDKAGFTSEHAQAVLRLALLLESWAGVKVNVCFVLDGNPNSKGWPRCDQLIKAKVPRVIEQCTTYGKIGLPYNAKDNSSFIAHGGRQTKYLGGPKWLWHGQIRPEEEEPTQKERFSAEGTTTSTTLPFKESVSAALTTNTAKWHFNYIEVSTKGRLSPQNCDWVMGKSCGRCIRIGNGMRGGFHSRLFQVTNVFYQKDYGAWFYGDDEELVKGWGAACAPSWNGWPSNGYQWYEYEKQPRSRSRPNFSCSPQSAVIDPVLLVAWGSATNLYSFYTDTVLTSFMTAAHIAKSLGCPRERIRVYITAGGSAKTKFTDIWNFFFTNVQIVNKMDGCYRTVYYGQMVMNVPNVDLNGVIYDPTLSSWMSAFRQNLRAGMIPEEMRKYRPKAFLVSYPLESPAWLDEIDWSLDGVKVERIKFHEIPYRQQIIRVAVSKGLLGLAGLGIQQQFFAPPGSLIGYVGLLGIAPKGMFQVENLCGILTNPEDPKSLQAEERALCHLNTAVNLGNTALFWRWCQKDVTDQNQAFTSKHAKAVFTLLMSLAKSPKVHSCLVLDQKTNSRGWPRCDQHVEVAAPQAAESCGTYGKIGMPYSLEDKSSFLERDSRAMFTPYQGGPKWLWLDKPEDPNAGQDQQSDEQAQQQTAAAPTPTLPASSNLAGPDHALMSSATETPQWSFTYADSTNCPRTCEGQNVSCGRCIRVGNGMRNGMRSNIYQVSNVYYQLEHGAWFFGKNERKVIACGTACNPTWEGWPGNGYQWFEYDNQPRQRQRPKFTCRPNDMIMEPVVMVRWMFPQNAYHFYVDTVLSTYMTVGLVSKVLGCSREKVKVYIICGMVPTFFPDIWTTMFNKIQAANEMNGCYKTVFYGHMFYNVPHVDLPGVEYDPTLSSWAVALNSNLRSRMMPTGMVNSGEFLLVHHNRAPDWFFRINWTSPGFRIRMIDFARLPYQKQIGNVMAAAGLLGVAGAGLTQQVFLPPGSRVLYGSILEAQQGSNRCATRMSKTEPSIVQQESSALCYMNVAVNVGHMILMWRWCRPNIHDDSSAFSSDNAQKVLKLLLSLDAGVADAPKAHACMVLDGNPNGPDWPRCDQHLVVPASRVQETCSVFGAIGLPYNRKHNSSDALPDRQGKYMAYKGTDYGISTR